MEDVHILVVVILMAFAKLGAPYDSRLCSADMCLKISVGEDE